jgi:type IX secretion system substrate protein/fibronectin type III domain protein
MKLKIVLFSILLSWVIAFPLNANESDIHKIIDKEEIENVGRSPIWCVPNNLSPGYSMLKGNILDLAYVIDRIEFVNESDEQSKYEYTYNPNIKTLTEVRFMMNNDKWLKYYQKVNTFDENRILVQTEYSNFVDYHWVNNQKRIYTNDENGVVAQIIIQYWVDENWADRYKYEYFYDDDGTNTSYTLARWYSDKWNESDLYVNAFGVNGVLTSTTSRRYTNNKWENSNKTTYTYDQNQNMISNISQYWSDYKWNSSYKIEYEYDEDQILVISENFNWDNAWKKSNRDAYSYDENDNLIAKTRQVWIYEPGFSRWDDISRLIYVFDEKEHYVRYHSEIWEDKTWVPSTFSTFNYNDPYENNIYVSSQSGNYLTNMELFWGVLEPFSISLSIPENEATKIEIAPTLEWKETPNAETYTIQISKDAEFEQILIEQTGILVLNYDVADLENYTTYYWRVHGENYDKTGEWSEVWSFRTIALPPEFTTKLISPVNETVDENIENIELTWDVNQEAEVYTLQVSSTVDFADADIVQEYSDLSETSKILDVLEHSKMYYWRVQGINEGGEAPWSEIWTFETVISPPLNQVVLASPVNYVIDVQYKNLELSWDTYATADTYTIHVSQERFFKNDDQIIKFENVAGTTQILEALEKETIYYWRVKAINKGGEGPWSDSWKFTTGTEVSVEEIADMYSLTVYPNPTSSNATISYLLPQATQITIAIYDEFGSAILKTNEQTKAAGDHVYEFNTDNLSSGMYYYSINIGAETINGQIVKIK